MKPISGSRFLRGIDEHETRWRVLKAARPLGYQPNPIAQSLRTRHTMLRLLEHCTRNEPQCTIVFSAVSDHCNYLRGEQNFMGYVHFRAL